jgi:hypothetical protein
MRSRFLLTSVAVLGSAAVIACSGPGSITSPSVATPSILGASVQALVVGLGNAGPSSPGISVSVSAAGPVTASAKLEMSFDDGSSALEIPFEPQSISIGANRRGMLSTSVPAASDPRLAGRKPASYRAVITLRDEFGAERTVVVPFSIPG